MGLIVAYFIHQKVLCNFPVGITFSLKTKSNKYKYQYDPALIDSDLDKHQAKFTKQLSKCM